MRIHTHNKVTQDKLSPHDALRFLREGNERFRANLRANRDLLQQVNETRDGQYPFATILSCIDSRTSAELIFDQGFGDVFSIRIAGTIVNDDILGSMEFATKVAGSKLIVVLGHSACGAIKGACDHVQMGNLSTLLNKIPPSVYVERITRENRTSKNPEFVERVMEIQVRRSVEAIVERSILIRELIEKGDVGLVGGLYSVETGAVTFLEDTYMCGEVKHFYLEMPHTRYSEPPAPPAGA